MRGHHLPTLGTTAKRIPAYWLPVLAFLTGQLGSQKRLQPRNAFEDLVVPGLFSTRP